MRPQQFYRRALLVPLALLTMGLAPLAGVEARLNAAPPANVSRATGGLAVQYRVGNTSATDNQIAPHFQITNGGSASVALADLKIRYFYTKDGTQAQIYDCDWAMIGCANVRSAFGALASPVASADSYLEISFTGGSVAPGGSTGDIQGRIHKSDWTNYNENGDYSFDPTKTSFADWPRVALYQSGALVWGSEPSGGALPTSTPTARATATPTRVGATATPTPRATSTPTPRATSTPTPRATSTPTLPGGWFEPLNALNSSLWATADGWTNGAPFNNGWRADHVTFNGGIMTLRLDNQPCPSGCSNTPYASGEYRTKLKYGYGRVEARFKAARGSGLMAGSLFTYTGPSNGDPWDEIDIEILGKDTTKMQLNYFTSGTGGHETIISLGFDAAADFHTYAFEWSPTSIKWYVDGALVHTETGSRGPLPTHPGQIMVNLWPGIGVDGWLGPFRYPGTPITASYDWISYTPR